MKRSWFDNLTSDKKDFITKFFWIIICIIFFPLMYIWIALYELAKILLLPFWIVYSIVKWFRRKTNWRRYRKYLTSEYWRTLKKTKLNKKLYCEICWNKAHTVHHLSYERLRYEKEQDVVSVCKYCHTDCHFDDGKKIKNNEYDLTNRFEDLQCFWVRNSESWSALWNAVKSNNTDMVRSLLYRGVDPNWGYDTIYAPLYEASSKWYTDIVELLLRYWAEIDMFSIYDDTALYIALLNGHIQIVKLLIRHWADVHVSWMRGTLLSLARRQWYKEIEGLIIKYWEHNNKTLKQDNQTNLMSDNDRDCIFPF